MTPYMTTRLHFGAAIYSKSNHYIHVPSMFPMPPILRTTNKLASPSDQDFHCPVPLSALAHGTLHRNGGTLEDRVPVARLGGRSADRHGEKGRRSHA